METQTPSQTREALLKDVERLKRNAAQVVQDVRDHATAHIDEKKQQVTAAVLTTRETLVSHPLSLLGAGLAIGFLLGLRVRR